MQRIMDKELKVEMEFPIKLYCNNKAVINISLNPVQHDRTKYVEVDTYFIKEKVDDGIIYMTCSNKRANSKYAY